jgi:hypothetical protein
MTNDLPSAAHARQVLDELLAERATALGTGLAHNVIYMDDLETDLEAAPRGLCRTRGQRDRDAAWRAVRPAGRLNYASRPAHTVTRSAGKPTFVATSHAAWSSFSVRTSRTTMTAPSRSIVHPACLAAASSAGRCSPGSNPSGKVTSNSSDPGGCSAFATRQA